jgi:hypothetical protein
VFKMTVILVMVGAILNTACVVCALGCCCDLMPTSHLSDDGKNCPGPIHTPHINLDWLTFDHASQVILSVAWFSPPPAKIQAPTADLSVDTPPPQTLASL